MKSFCIVLLGFFVALTPALAAPAADSLENLSLEELMAVEITSVGKRPQKLADAAAAVYVISQQDLRRSGVSSIPEAQRMVPGLPVARINANQWAISARGFNGRFANKLLVLIDGRSVYNPLYSGVYWDVQDLLLEDVERIEVIRGPGAALWGANAVNGVINIISRPSSKTQGTLVSARAGTDDREFAVRQGGTFGTTGTFRLYGKGKMVDEGENAQGVATEDAWKQGRFGFRADWRGAADDAFTLQGDLYRSLADSLTNTWQLAAPYSTYEPHDSMAQGGNLLFRWQNDRGSQLQLYYDRADRDELLYENHQDTIDLDWQQQLAWGERQQLLWGLGYRWTHDRTQTPRPDQFSVADAEDSHSLLSAFLQDDIQLLPETLVLTLGTKLEHNSYTNFEVQPNARLAWKPAPEHTLWTAVSRAVRTPSRVEDSTSGILSVQPDDFGFPVGTIPVVYRAASNADFRSEELLAWEAGYRYVPSERFRVDLATFFNRYDNLRTGEVISQSTSGTPLPTSATVLFQADNKAGGDTLGAELALSWQVVPRWRLQASYSYLDMRIALDDDSTDLASVRLAHEVYSCHQGGLRSQLDLAPGVDLDLWLRAVGPIERSDIAGYVTLDARLGWEVTDRLELSLVGQNLLGSGHQEFREEVLGGYAMEVQPSGYLMLRWEF